MDTINFIGLVLTNKIGQASVSACNEFYVSAFENDFKVSNKLNCSQVKIPENMPADFKMGYTERRKR